MDEKKKVNFLENYKTALTKRVILLYKVYFALEL